MKTTGAAWLSLDVRGSILHGAEVRRGVRHGAEARISSQRRSVAADLVAEEEEEADFEIS